MPARITNNAIPPYNNADVRLKLSKTVANDLIKKSFKTLNSIIIVININMSSKIRSRILSLITVPKDAGMAILSVFFNMAQRVTSPIRGKSRLAKYPTITAIKALKVLTLYPIGFSNRVQRYPRSKWLINEKAIEIYTNVKLADFRFSNRIMRSISLNTYHKIPSAMISVMEYLIIDFNSFKGLVRVVGSFRQEILKPGYKILPPRESL